jgi:hypothetical protein
MNEFTINMRSGVSNNIGTASKILCNADVVHPSGEQITIVSSSTDDIYRGNGLQTILIYYFTSSWAYQTEVVALDGTDPVNTVCTDIFRIEHVEATATGSYRMAVGTITLKSIDGTKLFAQIDPDTTSFMRLLHYVRPGYRLYVMTALMSSITSQGVVLDFVTTNDFTPYGGNIVMSKYRMAELKAPIFTNLGELLICDATYATRPLGIGLCVHASLPSQSASATVSYKEFHARDV